MPTAAQTSLAQTCINTIRGLAMDAVQKANSGHPGMPMGCAPMAYVLWTKHLRFDPSDPHWFNRDRFVLSAGHGSMLLYSLLHLTGYELTLDDLKQFRQLHSKTPGHPENFATPGVEMATGPLGQGFAHGVGMAMAEAHLAVVYNQADAKIIDHYTYAICSDGDLMEGISNESASLAGHLQLGKLIYLYDSNHITIDGKTDIAFTEDTGARFEALGWHVQHIDGLDIEAVDKAIIAAQAERNKPSLIVCRTIIGYGSPNKAGKSSSHGSPLGPEEVDLAKKELGIPLEPKFYVPAEVYEEFHQAANRGREQHRQWNEALDSYSTENPALGVQLRNAIDGVLGAEWLDKLPNIDEKLATRAASGKVLNAIAASLPGLVGGSADLAESNNTDLKGYEGFQPSSYQGRNLHFGVREHAMIAAVNGITLHGGLRAYGASFLIFTDYCRPSIRLAALMECPSIYIFTHDSIGLGEDGPTHQPIEQLAALRAIPNLNVMRPADGNETAACWKIALESKKTPCLLALTRQGLPPLTPNTVKAHPAEKGAYMLQDSDGKPDLILVATGSELQVAVEAAKQMPDRKVRIVSLPSWYLFALQGQDYRNQILPREIPTISIEAATTFGWDRYASAHVGIDRFGLSAPGDQVMKEFGITPEHVVEVANSLLK